MAITLELTPEIEARLIAQAAAQGVTAEAFLQAAILPKKVANPIEHLLNAEPLVYRLGTTKGCSIYSH